MTSLVTIAIALSVAYGVLFGAFLAISFAIRREDSVGSLTGQAPSRACRSARFMTGWHRARWESIGSSHRRIA
jgi:hypothetical protein